MLLLHNKIRKRIFGDYLIAYARQESRLLLLLLLLLLLREELSQVLYRIIVVTNWLVLLLSSGLIETLIPRIAIIGNRLSLLNIIGVAIFKSSPRGPLLIIGIVVINIIILNTWLILSHLCRWWLIKAYFQKVSNILYAVNLRLSNLVSRFRSEAIAVMLRVNISQCVSFL